MNLVYSILWFDDDKDFFDSIDSPYIKEQIYSWGFQPNIVPIHNGNEFYQHNPFTTFDLIVVDFRLGDEQGDKFIEDIREQQIDTEIIFYSANETSDLWRAIHDRQLEGVFVTSKRTIVEKVLRVAKQTVRKVLDLENMRGIVMAEVGDLDSVLEGIFLQAMDSISDADKKKIFDAFHDKQCKNAETNQKALSDFKHAPSVKSLLNLCDSNKRWENFNRVRSYYPALKNSNLGNYPEEILKPRNFLAHGVPTRKLDGSYVFKYRNREFDFNDNIGQSIRKKILEYKAEFTKIKEALKKKT